MYNNLTTFASITPHLPISAPENNYFPARETEDWQYEQLDNHPAKSDKLWNEARAVRDFLADRTPAQQAQEYFDRYPNYPPDRFYTSTRQRKAKAKHTLQLSGWATKLLGQLGHPTTPAFFYTLSVANLGLPIDYADPRYLYAPTVIAEIKAAIAKHIPKPFYWRVEVGRDGAVHVHLIAQAAPLLSYLAGEGSKRVQAIRPGTELALLAYLAKPTAPWSAANYATYLEAVAHKQTSRLPNLSGQLGIKKSPQRGRL
jgi:hypothetical protein